MVRGSQKHIRTIYQAQVFDWNSGKVGEIELSLAEKDELEGLQKEKKENETLVYTRTKVRGKAPSYVPPQRDGGAEKAVALRIPVDRIAFEIAILKLLIQFCRIKLHRDSISKSFSEWFEIFGLQICSHKQAALIREKKRSRRIGKSWRCQAISSQVLDNRSVGGCVPGCHDIYSQGVIEVS